MPQSYIGYARSRLAEAGERYRNIPAQGFEANRGELAKIASMTWDAVIDVLSALALLDNKTLTGRSTDLVRYVKEELGGEIKTLWRAPARLHNFQHKPDHSDPNFRQAVYYTGVLLQMLNERLPAELRLPEMSWSWLLAAALPQPGD